MKKLESSLLNMTVVLTVISVIAGGLLAYVNGVTEGPIREIKEKALADGIKSVLQAEEATVQQIDTIDGGVAIVYKTDKGTAVQAVNNNAFGGTIKVLVGFDAEGTILGYSVLEHAETPGLGAKAGEWFQQGAKGDIIGKHPAKNIRKFKFLARKLSRPNPLGPMIIPVTSKTITPGTLNLRNPSGARVMIAQKVIKMIRNASVLIKK